MLGVVWLWEIGMMRENFWATVFRAFNNKLVSFRCSTVKSKCTPFSDFSSWSFITLDQENWNYRLAQATGVNGKKQRKR